MNAINPKIFRPIMKTEEPIWLLEGVGHALPDKGYIMFVDGMPAWTYEPKDATRFQSREAAWLTSDLLPEDIDAVPTQYNFS